MNALKYVSDPSISRQRGISIPSLDMGSQEAPRGRWGQEPTPGAPEEPYPLCRLKKEEIKAIVAASTTLSCYNTQRNGALGKVKPPPCYLLSPSSHSLLIPITWVCWAA